MKRKYIHINDMRRAMKEAVKPFDVSVWTRSGEIQHWKECVSLKFEMRTGLRRLKLTTSRQIRTIHDVQIFRFNGQTVFL